MPVNDPTAPHASGRHDGPDAFVLSGGAAHGAIQVGMPAALARGITPDLITATSAGALNAVFIASRPATPATTNELAQIWIRLRRRDVFPTNAITGALGSSVTTTTLCPHIDYAS